MQLRASALFLCVCLFAQATAAPSPGAAAEQAAAPRLALLLLDNPELAAQRSPALAAGATLAQALKTAGLALALCSALFIFACWLRRLRGHQHGRLLKVVEVTPLGSARTLTVIEINGARYLIGSTAQSISLLAKLERQPEQDLFPEVGSKAGGADFKGDRWGRSEVFSRLRELHRALRL